MSKQINYVALIAGILTLLLIVISIFVPWWQLNVGQPPIASVNFSPVNMNFSFFDDVITVPLIWALNIACLLTLAAGGIAMLIYSLLPTKSYAKKLLGFGYKKPLYSLILFIIELITLYLPVEMLSGFDFPLVGSAALHFPESLMPDSINISVNVTASFGWPFYLGIAVVVLCIAARLYHGRIASQAANPQ
jgi:hypothetical protein